MSFKDSSFVNSGGHFVRQSETVKAILVGGLISRSV